MSDTKDATPTGEILKERTCPNCGGSMLATNDDEYCLSCIHEGRV